MTTNRDDATEDVNIFLIRTTTWKCAEFYWTRTFRHLKRLSIHPMREMNKNSLNPPEFPRIHEHKYIIMD